MPADVLLLVATAVLAVVATVAACVAVAAVRRAGQHHEAVQDAARAASRHGVTDRTRPAEGPTAPASAALAVRGTALGPHPAQPQVVQVEPLPSALEPHVVEGRVVVPPTHEQVARTAMSRPQVRISVVAHGIAHALRPESRDRISAMMRREYRGRRRERLRAGRRAARAARPDVPADRWLGET